VQRQANGGEKASWRRPQCIRHWYSVRRVLWSLNSHNHNQHAGQAVLFSCRPNQAFKVYPTLRYFPTPKQCITRQCACDSCARRLLTVASVNHGRTVVRPLQTERSASDADDNRTALYAPPTARVTELGMSLSLPIFIQLRKDNGRRRISHLCQRTKPLAR
jgi:hypothetical protein